MIDAVYARMICTNDTQLLHIRYCTWPVHMCPTQGKMNHMYNVVYVHNLACYRT